MTSVRPSPERSIPAWAGETFSGRHTSLHIRVYPRVGGGNTAHRPAQGYAPGLSPRGRGKQCLSEWGFQYRWSIPAWAGETTVNGNQQITITVYPRVGGGNADDYQHIPGLQGLSPRGRGKPHRATARPGEKRSIPAWAGETSR